MRRVRVRFQEEGVNADGDCGTAERRDELALAAERRPCPPGCLTAWVPSCGRHSGGRRVTDRDRAVSSGDEHGSWNAEFIRRLVHGCTPDRSPAHRLWWCPPCWKKKCSSQSCSRGSNSGTALPVFVDYGYTIGLV